MKWIGQQIYDLASRFRNDVYLEDISTGTIASGAHLGLDSNNKIVKAVDGGGDLTSIVAGTGLSGTSLAGPIPTLNIDAAQTGITSLGTLSSLTVGGNLTVNGDSVTFQSANADDPIVTIKNTSNDANDMASLQFVKDRGAAPAVGDNLAEIYFIGEDADQNSQEYGRILCETDVVTGGQESGVLKFGVANHDGGNGYGLIMTGGSANNEVDVTVGLGASSVVTIPGHIAGDVTGDLTGQAQSVSTIAGLAPNTATTQATQGAITSCANLVTVGTIGTGTWNATAIASAKMATGTSSAQGALELATTAEATTGTDTARAVTPAGLKAYADRPAKQIVLMRAAFKDDIGTTKHYIPLQSELEQTNSFHEMNSFVAPFAGKLLKLMYNGSGNFSGGEFSFTLEQIPRNVAFATTPTVLETIAIDGPTNDTTDPNMIIANFVGGSGTNSFTAGDLIMVGIQSDADVTSSTSKHFFTLVFEFDFSSLA